MPQPGFQPSGRMEFLDVENGARIGRPPGQRLVGPRKNARTIGEQEARHGKIAPQGEQALAVGRSMIRECKIVRTQDVHVKAERFPDQAPPEYKFAPGATMALERDDQQRGHRLARAEIAAGHDENEEQCQEKRGMRREMPRVIVAEKKGDEPADRAGHTSDGVLRAFR